jgi:hypothetical protein
VLGLTGDACGTGLPPCQWGFCDGDAGTCQDFRAPFSACQSDGECGAASDANLCALPGDGGPGTCNTCEPLR